jgi:hypothetical protein
MAPTAVGYTAGSPDANPHLRGRHQQLDLADSRLAGVDLVLGEDRHEVLAECLEGLPGLPYVEDVDSVADWKPAWKVRPGGLAWPMAASCSWTAANFSAVMPWTAK